MIKEKADCKLCGESVREYYKNPFNDKNKEVVYCTDCYEQTVRGQVVQRDGKVLSYRKNMR